MTKKRQVAAAAVLVAIAATAVSVWALWPTPQPNVVVIIIDTLRQDKLGAYGSEHETSPEIDRMANEGVRFDRAIAQSSWTRPSIGSMLTSQYPRTLGIYKEGGDILADDFETIAEVLKGAGYTTLGATANPNINSSFNFHQGFDHYSDSDVVFPWMDAEKGQESLAKAPLLSARQIFDSLLKEVKERKSPPYYLQANIMEVHEWLDRRMDLRKYQREFLGARDQRYLATIRLVSEEIERFVAELTALPEFKHTLFVFVSDHGEGLFDHEPVGNSSRHGLLLYESQVLVPLILFATDGSLPRGKVVEAPVRLLDLVPTLLDYAGIEEPPGLAGKSLLASIEGSSAPDLPDHFIVETELRSADAIAAYGPGWNYFEHRAPHPGTDPRELQEEAVDESGANTNALDAHPEVGAELQSALDAWERAHPKVKATKRATPLPAIEEAQLRALGYID
ncbi:MAG: sulfatase [Myxococcota bacterium]